MNIKSERLLAVKGVLTMIPDGERNVITVVRENIERYMELNSVSRQDLRKLCGNQTVDNMLNDNTVNGCSIISLQRIAGALGIKTIDLIEDWSEG